MMLVGFNAVIIVFQPEKSLELANTTIVAALYFLSFAFRQCTRQTYFRAMYYEYSRLIFVFLFCFVVFCVQKKNNSKTGI